MQEVFTIPDQEAGQRLDVWCVANLPGLSRAAIQKLIKAGEISVDGKQVKPKHIIQAGNSVRVALADQVTAPEIPQEIPAITILHEDNDLVVINKPAGIAVHPSTSSGQVVTLVDWFTGRYPQATGVGEAGRPGVVHRLDKDTSGVLVFAKNPPAYERLKDQFKRHRIRKEYIALVFGIPTGRDGRIVQPIGRSTRNPARRTVIETGKPAITEWKVERTFGNDYTLLRIFPFTGRTHQIRVHMHFINHPIVGDHLYTFKRQRPPAGTKRQLLHAQSLTLQLISGKKKTFEAPLAADFEAVLSSLQGSSSPDKGR